MPQAQLRIAEASLRSRDFDEAMRYAEEALRSSPGLTGAHAVLANVYLAQGEAKKAEEEIKIVLEREPGSPAALATLFRGIIHFTSQGRD